MLRPATGNTPNGLKDMSQIKVGINGYGVIGKRIADAIHKQPDMQLVGVADVATDYRTCTANTH